MRVPVLIKMYKGKLEIYGDGEDFDISIKRNNEDKILHYSKDDNKFKPLLVIDPKDIIYFNNDNYPHIFCETDPDRWEAYHINKNKVLRNNRKYLLAITLKSTKKGLFHNVQKTDKTRE